MDGYGSWRQRKFASLHLAHDAKASRVEYAYEPAVTTSSSTMVPARMALSVSLISNMFTKIMRMIQIYIHLCFIQTSLAFVA